MAPRISTWLSDRFDLDLPVVTAPMAGVAEGRFAAAASAAGILGTIGVGSDESADWIRSQAGQPASEGRRYGVGLMAWAQSKNPGQLEAVLDLAPALVSVSFGDYESAVAPLHAVGSTVVTQVGTVAQAREAAAHGVDAVVARGLEGGGHGFDLVATLPLLQAVLEAVDVPVLAAGGIGTARGLAAVIAAGAAGAWVGTAFTCCRESVWPDEQVAQVHDADETSTGYGHVFDIASAAGWPADIGGRTLRNEFFDRWRGQEEALLHDEAALARFRAAPAGRDFATMPVYIGQGVGLLDGSRPTVADVVADLSGAAQLLSDAAARVSPTGPGGVAQ